MMDPVFSLEGKTVIVTGAAQGIGRAIVDQALAAGANVAAVDLNTSQLQPLLDAQGSQWLQDFLLTQKQAGVTTVFSSHALAPVQVLADGVLQLVRGTGTVQPVQP